MRVTRSERGFLTAAGSRRRVLGGLAVAAVGSGAGALAACASAGPTGDSPAGRAAVPVTLQVMDRVGSEEEVYPLRVPAFEAANPAIKVAYDLSPEWGATKVTTLAAAGGLPDLGHILVNTQDFHAFFLQGVLLPVDDLVRRDRHDLKQYYAEAVRSLQVDG